MHYYWVIFSIVVALLTLMSLHQFYGSCYWRNKRLMMMTSLFKRSFPVALPFFPLCNVTLALSFSCLSKGSQGAQWISTGQLFHHKEGSSSYRRFGKPFFCLGETHAVYFCLCKGNITYCKFFSTSASWHGCGITNSAHHHIYYP